MRFVQQAKNDPSTLEIAWMFLPTFIGQNQALLKELDVLLNKHFPAPFVCEDARLDEIHQFIVDHIDQRVKLSGLKEYLLAVCHVGRDLSWQDDPTEKLK